MKIPVTWKEFERYWYLFSLAVIIVFLPFSKYFLSMGQMMLAGGWIVERFDYKKLIEKYKSSPSSIQYPVSSIQYPISRIPHLLSFAFSLLFRGIFSGFRQFFRHKPALIFSSIFFLHILGLFFTTDFDYALKDLRTKLPLFLLPLFLSTSKAFDNKTFHRYLLLLVVAVLVRSVFNTWMIATNNYIDIRDVSRNVSHIIFSLLITLCILTLGYFVYRRKIFSTGWKIVLFAGLCWLFSYLIISRSFTGLSILILTLLILVPFLIYSSANSRVRIAGIVAILTVTAAIILTLRSVVNDYYRVAPLDITKLDSVTSRGNRYIHNFYSRQTENGNYLWYYVQWDEMRAEWNKRSQLDFDSLDRKNQIVAQTVVHYLTSRGWRKDGDAVMKLTDREIAAIEKGVTNAVFLEEFSIRGRIYEFLDGYEKYRETGDPTGSTVMQRIEFWKASIGIISENWLFGVGTGDMNEAFARQYEKMQSKLAPDQRWRSHNQFLSIWIGFGIFGLIWFLFAIFLPPVMMKSRNDYFVVIIIIISVLSMLTEDTIESQTGVTFFALFYSLFLFARKEIMSQQ